MDGTPSLLPAFEFRGEDDKPVKPGPLLLIEWADAYASRKGWEDVADVVADLGDVYVVHTVGWLVGQNEQNVRLAAQVHAYVSAPGEASQVDFIQTIPRVCVRRVTPLS